MLTTAAADSRPPEPFDEFVACHECDQVNRVRAVPGGGPGKCRRCGATLYRDVANSISVSLWLSITAAILFVIANVFPILTFKLEGREQVASIATGVFELNRQGFWEVAMLVLLLSIVFPMVRIGIAIYILVPLYLGRTPWQLPTIFRTFDQLAPWAMMEVYLLALIVAYVKLTELSTLIIGVAAYAFVAMIIVTTWSSATLDPRAVWRKIAYKVKGRDAQAHPDRNPSVPPQHHISCHYCDLIVDADSVPHGQGVVVRCPRCRGVLHRRKPNSIATAWAYVIAAVICYLPANLLPIMTVISFGEGAPDTILSGVKELIAADMYPIAALVFFASIFVPVLKISILIYLLISIQTRSHSRPRERTVLYRLTETVGRWSMLDIFMISILAALVKLGAIATIEPGPAAIFFAAVVILTMFSAMAFDPRLMWDAMQDERHERS